MKSDMKYSPASKFEIYFYIKRVKFKTKMMAKTHQKY